MTLDKLTVYEKNLARIHEWIRSVDQKLGIFFALQAAFIVFITPLFLQKISEKYPDIPLFVIAMIIVAYALIAYGLLKCVRSLYSSLRTKGQSITEDQLSLTYFNHIQNIGLASYKKKMKSLTKNIYEDELLSQIHVSACIATSKHRHFNDALILFVSGSAFAIIAISWLYLM